MMNTNIASIEPSHIPIGDIVETDKEEKEFEEIIKLWVNDKISYEKLMENYPKSEDAKWKKLVRVFLGL